LPIENTNRLVDETDQEREIETLIAKPQSEVNRLPVIDKALVSLMLEGLGMKAIADVIGLTESNIKVKIHRIKNDLKTKLNNNEPK
jgi:RNA polymerase sigma-70 factor (ECF subfamily)